MTSSVLSLTKSYFSFYSGLTPLVWCVIVVNLIEAILLGIFYFLPIYFVHDLNFTLVSAGFIISFFGCRTILGGYLGGLLSDFFHAGKVCIVSLVFQSLVFISLVIFKTYFWLCLAMFAMGFFSYMFLTANHLWVLNMVSGHEKKRLKALNILNVVNNLGLAISALSISLCIPYGFSNLFFYGGLIFIFLFFLCSILFPYTLLKNETLITKSDREEKNIFAYKEPKKLIRITLFCTVLMGFIIFQTNTTYSEYLQQMFPKLGANALSILFTVNCVIVIVLQTPLMGILGNLNRLVLMGVGTFLIGTGMMILSFSSIFEIAIVSCVVYTLGEIVFCSVSQLLCYELGSLGQKGNMLGVYRMVYATSRVTAPIIGTAVFQSFSPFILWYLCGVLGIVCLCLCLSVHRWEIKPTLSMCAE